MVHSLLLLIIGAVISFGFFFFKEEGEVQTIQFPPSQVHAEESTIIQKEIVFGKLISKPQLVGLMLFILREGGDYLSNFYLIYDF